MSSALGASALSGGFGFLTLSLVSLGGPVFSWGLTSRMDGARLCGCRDNSLYFQMGKGLWERGNKHIDQGALSKGNLFRKECILRAEDLDMALQRAVHVQEPPGPRGGPPGLLIYLDAGCFRTLFPCP